MSVILVLGGARSGKSRFAESLVHQPAHYVATAQAFDDEMRERIAAHKVQRGTAWVTHEEPLDLVGVLERLSKSPLSPSDSSPSRTEGADKSFRSPNLLGELSDGLRGSLFHARSNFILVDCLTLWLSNLLLAERDCDAEIDRLLAFLKTTSSRIVIVSNEVGLGIVPDNALARRFRDVQGIANQRVAEIALNVVFMAAGLPMALKGPLPTAQW
jgi:adenosylcobinamide kinase / adenosylcobinamide-phosphate guanylyltransferase